MENRKVRIKIKNSNIPPKYYRNNPKPKIFCSSLFNILITVNNLILQKTNSSTAPLEKTLLQLKLLLLLLSYIFPQMPPKNMEARKLTNCGIAAPPKNY